MKKLLQILIMAMLILPLSSFTTISEGSSLDNKKQTSWLVGYFMYGGDEYEVYGDNYGMASGSVVSLKKNGVAVPFSDESTWATNYGPTHLQIGVDVQWVSGGAHSYSGPTYY